MSPNARRAGWALAQVVLTAVAMIVVLRLVRFRDLVKADDRPPAAATAVDGLRVTWADGSAGTYAKVEVVESGFLSIFERADKRLFFGMMAALFVPFGLATLDEIVRPRRRQLRSGIVFHEAEVGWVHSDRDEVLLADGEILQYDVLIVATGSRLQPDETEGLTGPGWNERVFTFYTPDGADALRAALEKGFSAAC